MATVKAVEDAQMEGWLNAMCPYCERTATYDKSHRKIIARCAHLLASRGGEFIFAPDYGR